MILNILSEGNISVIIEGIRMTYCLQFMLPVLKRNSERKLQIKIVTIVDKCKAYLTRNDQCFLYLTSIKCEEIVPAAE